MPKLPETLKDGFPLANEVFFLLHILIVAGFSLAAVRLGAAALTALVALEGVLANLFVIKQMSLFGLVVTCSDVFAIGGILGLNLLQEHFGKAEAQRAIRICLFTLVFMVLVSQVHLLYLPASVDSTQDAFSTVLSSTPRIVAASIFVYYIVQKMDVVLFGWLKNWLGERRLGIRMGISLLISQWVDTVLFSFLGLYGLVASIASVIVVSFAVKCLVIGAAVPLSSLSQRMFGKKVSG